MDLRVEGYDLTIASVKKAVPTADGGELIVQAEGTLGGERRALAIAVKTELAPLVAVSLLSALRESAGVAGVAGGNAPSLLCLAAGVVSSADPGLLRVHLQFDSGLVLPVEMPRDAAVALLRGLADELAPTVAKPRAPRARPGQTKDSSIRR